MSGNHNSGRKPKYLTIERFDDRMDSMDREIVKIRTVLLGANGDKGLVGQVSENTSKINRNTVILAAILGSGVLGGSIVGIIQAIT